MNKKQFILKYIEKSNNDIVLKEAIEDINVLFDTLKNVLISQGKVSFFGKGNFELFEKKERTIGKLSAKGTIRLPAEKTIKFKASPRLNKLFNKKG